MNLHAKTIPHNKQRYATCGDFFVEKGVEQFRISSMPKESYEWLVLIHEIVERFLCKMEGVKNSDIDKFDIKFEIDRGRGLHSNTQEPGDDKAAPYGRQHCVATAVERMLCGYLGISWAEYDDAIQKLDYRKPWENRLPAVD